MFIVNMLYVILFLYPFSETLISHLPIFCPFVFLAFKFLIQGGFFPYLKYFFERNDAKAEAPVLWPPHAKSCLIAKDSDAGRDWGQEEKGMTEAEMAGWHHRLDEHESE